ncbi:unnamed protein product, partial [Linum tenue]
REEYGPLAAALRARDTTIALEDLHDRLVDFEADFDAHRSSSALAPTTAFSSTRGHSFPAARGRGSPRRSRQVASSVYPDTTYRGHSPARRYPSSTGSSSAQSLLGRPPPLCQFCDKTGHTAKDCYQIRGRPQAHHTMTAGSTSSGWLLDSAATNHITPDLGGLSLYTDYHGPDEVIVGDGAGPSHGGASATRPE